MFLDNLDPDTNINEIDEEIEVMHPMNYPMKGSDNIGALLLFEGNRGWWTGSIMDHNDAKKLFGGKYGPTVLQVAAGVLSSFMYMCKNPRMGCIWPEYLDSEEILENSKEYIGSFVSKYVDILGSNLKDCTKFEDFLVDKKKDDKFD